MWSQLVVIPVGTEYGVWRREPGSHNYSVRIVSYFYSAEGDFEAQLKLPKRYSPPAPTDPPVSHGQDLRRRRESNLYHLRHERLQRGLNNPGKTRFDL